MLTRIGLQFTFATDVGSYEESVLYFYDRSPSGRGLDFAENPEQEDNFMRYCLNPVQNIAQTPLPQLEEIARGTTILLASCRHEGRNAATQDLDATLKAAGTAADWFIDPDANIIARKAWS